MPIQKNDDEEDMIWIDLKGSNMKVSRKLLASVPDTALAAMFSGVHSVAQTDGAIIIDRDPESFQYLLQYLENNHHWPDTDY